MIFHFFCVLCWFVAQLQCHLLWSEILDDSLIARSWFYNAETFISILLLIKVMSNLNKIAVVIWIILLICHSRHDDFPGSAVQIIDSQVRCVCLHVDVFRTNDCFCSAVWIQIFELSRNPFFLYNSVLNDNYTRYNGWLYALVCLLHSCGQPDD